MHLDLLSMAALGTALFLAVDVVCYAWLSSDRRQASPKLLAGKSMRRLRH